MSLAALNDIDDAIEATKRFLTPFDRVRWFRLAVVMFFVGGAGLSFPGTPTSFGGDPGTGEPTTGGPDITPELTGELIALILGVVALGIAAYLLYSVVAATMEFVFVGSLRDEEVRLRRSVKRYWRKGARLFVFRFATWILTTAVAGGSLIGLGTAMGGWPPTEWSDGTILLMIFLGVGVFLLVALVVGTFLGFTTMFVVPVMLREDRGVIGAWRRFWPTLTGNWLEFLAYLFVSFLLSIAVGIAVSFLLVLLAVAIAVPFLVVGVPLVLVLGFSGAGGIVAIVLFLAYLLLLFVGALLFQVPFQTFLRYYALLVLGDVNEEFDVVPDARAAVRADGGEDGTDDTGAVDDTDDGPDDADDGSGRAGASDGDGPSDDDAGWNLDDEDEWGDRDGRS
ncbi:DUF7544 domain-containing protein [Halosimplex salinum]|uniref:DUF7544 domain-containing protein n=1 Tax=Halosimplex salinum TaxID=1710538 RepID=UPI000F49343E|nr:hypothetical protein [Halosimplex salinum]